MKYETMIKILFLLLSRKKVTTSYIAKRFDISTRTALRYLTAISLADIPLISEPGRYGGYYVADSFKLPACFMSEKEFDAVISTLESCNEQLGNKEIDSATEKLKSLKRSDLSKNSLSSSHFVIDGSSWNGNDDIKNVVSTIENAIENKKTVNIKYRDKSGEETLREIEPELIILKQGLWYVYAYCKLRKDLRIFKVTRIIYADATNNDFVPRANVKNNLDLGEWFKNLPRENVELELSDICRSDIEEWLGMNSVYTAQDGKLRASAELPIDGWLITKLLGFGSGVKVLSPERLKKNVILAAKSVIELYNN